MHTFLNKTKQKKFANLNEQQTNDKRTSNIMKIQESSHLTATDKKVLFFMLVNNLSNASTKRNKYTLKKVDINFFEDAIEEFKSHQKDSNNITEKCLLSSAIIEATERISFLKTNDYKESYLFNKQLVLI